MDTPKITWKFPSNSSENCNIIKTIEAGSSFGEISFFTGQPRISTFKSHDFTKLFFIWRSDFLEMLKQFPHDYDKFMHIRDNILFKPN